MYKNKIWYKKGKRENPNHSPTHPLFHEKENVTELGLKTKVHLLEVQRGGKRIDLNLTTLYLFDIF